MKQKRGFTLLEVLVALSIIAIILGIVVMNGRKLLSDQEERASVGAVQKLLLQGATGANARNATVELRKNGRDYTLVETKNNKKIASRTLPDGVTLKLGGTVPANGTLLSFSSVGKISASQLNAFNSTINISTSKKEYDLLVSVIGEVEVTEQ